MVFVQELCLIPSNLVNDILNSDTSVAANIKKTDFVSNDNFTKRENLYPIIKSVFKTKAKLEKANNLYSWILKTYPEFEVSPSGDVIQPMKNINFLDFLRDIFSNSGNISKEKLNLYKIFTSIIDMPHYYIDNKLIKNYLYPNLTKNEISFSKPNLKPNLKRKKEEDDELQFSENDDLKTMNLYDSDDDAYMRAPAKSQKKVSNSKDVEKLEKFIDKEYKIATPIRRVSARKRNKTGSGIFFTKVKPYKKKQIKWLSF